MTSRRLTLAVLAALLSLSTVADEKKKDEEPSLPAAGSETFYKGKAEGWFWYKDPKEDEEEEKKLPPPPPPPPAPTKDEEPEAASQPEQPAIFSVKWLRENLDTYRDIAIDSPTEENVSRYYYMQRMMMDKASKFSEMSSKVIMKDPFLDEDSRRPVATYAANAMNKMAADSRDKVLKDLSQKLGLFYFFKSDCVLCVEQAGVLQSLNHATGISVIPVSMDGENLPNGGFAEYRVDSGQAEKLGIFQAPALALAIPPDKSEIVGYGAITLDVLYNRILIAAKDANVIDQKTFASTQPVNDTGLLSMEDAEGISEEMLKDPDALIEYMRTQLAKKNMEGK
ncbi:TPA: conjugal transfer protein TraF [Pseudomonas aeruginosa]|uniref:conjugal transfer protein TraF n=1 Tax=Pseudomonas aeruginosa TaxID=287 RepID=UPI0009AAB9EA|nr:conjugal transfer protein TraF [Pseudomonas aeruginosa]HCE7247000.1 conjugal transfer protein TraF [Pseudomonas aeruginosa]HCE8129629.1 conjugal transfer protein TraF [Pseudomonas aeruginosa]HCF0447765.1 conjugal transfer protein TraF [Pseudomonas aeruginosa]